MYKGIILAAAVLILSGCRNEQPAQEEVAAENMVKTEEENLQAILEKVGQTGVTVSGSAGNVRIETDGKTIKTIPKDKIEIGGTGLKKKAACNGEHVIVDGLNNNVTLTGRAGYLEVNGNGQTVFVESVNQIEINGNNNKIYWEEEVGGSKPDVIETGSGNLIEKKG